jgi:signal transduction histidine kinase
MSLPRDPAAVAGARRFCAQSLRKATDRAPNAQDSIRAAVLVISELTTNAIDAGSEHTVLVIDVHRSHVRVSVHDDGDGQPQVQHPSTGQTHGRGLLIVERLSRAWGVEPDTTGKRVWAELALPPHVTRTLSCELTDA